MPARSRLIERLRDDETWLAADYEHAELAIAAVVITAALTLPVLALAGLIVLI